MKLQCHILWHRKIIIWIKNIILLYINVFLLLSLRVSDIYSVFATKTERVKHLANEYFADTVSRAPLTKRDSRPRSLSHRAIVCGRFDKLPNNCQMLENDKVERERHWSRDQRKHVRSTSTVLTPFCLLAEDYPRRSQSNGYRLSRSQRVRHSSTSEEN